MSDLNPGVDFEGFALEVVGDCLKASMSRGVGMDIKALALEVTEGLIASRERLTASSNTFPSIGSKGPQ